MTALNSPRVSRLELKRLDEIDDALELMYFGLRGMTRDADDLLGVHGLSRSHHRILFVIARRDGLSVGELQAALGVSAQAMHGPMKQLRDKGFVAVSRDPSRHRIRSLHLTEQGRRVEAEASEAERKVIRDAFARAGDPAAGMWAKVMAIVAQNA